MLHEAYLSHRGLRRIRFDEALADPSLRICLKNLAEIARRRRATRAAAIPAVLELTPPQGGTDQ